MVIILELVLRAELLGNLNRYIQIDATSANGVSGGALLNENGKNIGIITLRLLDNNGVPIYGYVYAIPIDVVLEFVNLTE